MPELLGTADPDTLTSRLNAALGQAACGDVPAALAGLRAALRDAERSLGARHLRTIVLRTRTAQCEAVLGDTAAAVRQFELAVRDATAPLDRDHPDTVDIDDDLVHVENSARLVGRLLTGSGT